MSESSSMSRRQIFGAAALGVAAVVLPSAAEAKAPKTNNALAPMLSVLQAHNKAFSAHDLKGVMATMTPDVFILGDGPSEILKGQKEVSAAYQKFFSDSAKGEKFEPAFYEGGMSDNAGWIMAVTKIIHTKGNEKIERGLNVSVALVKRDGKWLIQSRTLTVFTD